MKLAEHHGWISPSARPSGKTLALPSDIAGRITPDTPMTADAWHERAVARERRGDLDGAIDDYTRSLLLGGPDLRTIFDLAYALAESGQHGRAIERYRQLLEYDPTHEGAWLNLADLLAHEGRINEAVTACERALDLDVENAAAHYNLADILADAGDGSRARRHWSTFLALHRRADAHAAYARYRLAEG